MRDCQKCSGTMTMSRTASIGTSWCSRRATLWGTLVLLGSLNAIGCCRVSKAAECNEFKSLINRSLGPIGKAEEAVNAARTGTGQAVEIAKASVSITSSCNEIAAARFNGQELQQFAKEYETACRALAKSSDDLATAMSNNDAAGVQKAINEIATLKQTAISLKGRVEAHCAAVG